jgi:catalase
MTTAPISLACAVTITCLVASSALAQDVDVQAIVDGQFALGGNHPMVRASGAKGTCVKGSFTPSAEAVGLSKAPHLARTVPVTARFSMGGSNPNISDKTKAVTRGFSMRLEDTEGDLVFVFISAPVFGAKSPEQLLKGIQLRLPGPDGKADADKIKAFAEANPETTRQSAWLNARPVPASFAGVDYWGVHAYTLTNAAGEARVAKLKFIAAAGQLGLTEEELKSKETSFYADELTGRLAKAPAAFDLVAILGEPGDPVNDVTAMWPEESRKQVKLGTLAIVSMAPDATCDANTFDPVVNLPDGITGPANDPMFEIRSPAYAISLSRRAN